MRVEINKLISRLLYKHHKPVIDRLKGTDHLPTVLQGVFLLELTRCINQINAPMVKNLLQTVGNVVNYEEVAKHYEKESE